MDSNHDMDLVRAVLGPAPDHEAQAKLAEAMDIASARRRDAQDAWLAAERARLNRLKNRLRRREGHAYYVTIPQLPLKVRSSPKESVGSAGRLPGAGGSPLLGSRLFMAPRLKSGTGTGRTPKLHRGRPGAAESARRRLQSSNCLA